jgi:hypothetical protein
LIAIVASGWAFADPNNGLAAMQQAAQDDAVYQNALLLYLRLAGVVWIAVEWAAAWVLWRTWRLLRKRIAVLKEPPCSMN